MLLIPCPYCGPRCETEFSYGGQAHLARPEDPDTLSDEAWCEYVFLRDNTKGVFLERWVHAQGCRRWFNVARNTVTYEILAVYEAAAPPPPLERKTEI
ncbi:MAG: sarcosine oxidase subunit delta [Kiloniellaceae bacterium]